ncbi:MAG: putative anti-sigma-YlaC factor YlaD [Mariniblastus sp.]|jgi:predicted anti-sigma-YlaC factor YlaD
MNYNSSCECFEPMISAMLDGELNSPEQLKLNAHLSQCSACRELAGVFSQVDASVSHLSLQQITTDAAALAAPTKHKLDRPHSKSHFSIWRMLPLAVAATLLVCLTIVSWPNSTPANADQITPAQFIEPMTDLHVLNFEKQKDQDLMLRTLNMDLRSLRIELSQLESSNEDREKINSQIDAMIKKVEAFE